MFDTISNFFSSIWDIIQSIGSFITQFIQGIITLFKVLPTVISTASQAMGYLPSVIAAFGAITITISIIFIVVGRDTGGA